jgi:hypothetical protein
MPVGKIHVRLPVVARKGVGSGSDMIADILMDERLVERRHGFRMEDGFPE